MDELNELIENLKRMAIEQIKVSTAWVKVKSVDWDSKKMECTGISDDLDWNDVLLGLGSIYQKPVVGSRCLIGRIEHSDAEAFLIAAEEVDEIWLNGDANNGLVKAQELVNRLNLIENKLNDLINSWNYLCDNYIPGSPTTIGTPTTAQLVAKKVTETETTDVSDIENEKVKHG